MARSFKRSRIEKYFRSGGRRLWPFALAVLGIAVIVGSSRIVAIGDFVPPRSSAQVETWIREAGGALLFIGAIAYAAFQLYIPGDKQIDQWAAQDRRVVNERAIRRFSVDSDQLIQDPIIFHYFAVTETALHRQGSDKLWRTSQLAATVINSTRSEFMIYLCRIDFLTGHFVFEEALSVFYQDVVSLAVRSEARTVELKNASALDKALAKQFPSSVQGGRLQINDVERVEMRLVNGSAVPIAMYNGGGAVSTEGSLAELMPEANAIDRLRKLIRDMRAQVADPTGATRP